MFDQLVRKRSLLGASLTIVAALMSSNAHAQLDEKRSINIDSRSAGLALRQLALQTGINILFTEDAVRGVVVAPFRANSTPELAARRLVSGTGLEVLRDANGGLLVRKAPAAFPQPIQRLAFAQPSPVAAQSAMSDPSGPTHSEPAAIEEVVVTARLRDETLQDVPVIVSVLSRQDLQAFGARSTEEIARMTPSLTVQASGGSAPVGSIVLRGITTTTNSAAAEQAVTIVVDGVTVGHALALRAGQIDLQQVEVLKGPQALYFGKNASGGVISLRTADPTRDLFVQARASYEFNGKEKLGELIVSGPISESLGYRAVVNYSNIEGYFKNRASSVVFDRTRPDYSELFGRFTLLWTPSDSFKARFKASYADHDGNGYTTNQKIVCNSAVEPVSDCTANDTFVMADPANGERPFDKFQTFITSLEMNIGISDQLDLTSLTGFSDIDQHFFDNVLPAQAGFNIWSNPRIATRNFSQELRLATKFAGSINGMIGAFYDDGRVASDSRLSVAVPQTHQVVDSQGTSVFGSITADITDSIELSGGVRYTRDEKSFRGANTTSSGPFPVGPWIISPSKRVFKNTSPEITLRWRPNRALNVFGSYKEGFKSGSFQIAQASNFQSVFAPIDIAFDAETARGGEVGLKSILFNDSLTMSLAAYRYNYRDLQLSTFDPATVTTRIINAGRSRVEGIESEASWRPKGFEGLTLKGALNYNRARFREFITDCNPVQLSTNTCPIIFNGAPRLQSLAGAAMPNAPEWSGSVGVYLDRPLGSGELRFRVNGSANYSSKYQSDGRNDPRGIQGNSWLINLGVGLSDKARGWDLDLIARNVTNEFVVVRTVSPQPGTGVPGDVNAILNTPRQIMLQLTVRPAELLSW